VVHSERFEIGRAFLLEMETGRKSERIQQMTVSM
jgi:hypothetical protein